jgi:putative PIG3 family NAD(P)H quinone oxidoreductase
VRHGIESPRIPYPDAVRCAVIVDGNVVASDRPTPAPDAGEVRVRVAGAGLNRADLVQRAGFYPAPPGSPPDIPGLEFAGTVDAIGPQRPGAADSGLQVGSRVFGIAGGGAQAEHIVVPASHCALVPDGLDLVAAGGVPEAFLTAHDAMVTRAAVQPGDWVLVHAVGSGVGTAAIQLATALGARTIGTARSADKLDRCAELGLNHGIVAPRTDDGALDVAALANAIVEATGGGANVTLDLVGGQYLEVDLAAAAPLGRIVMIGTLAGGRAEFDILRAMQRRIGVFGTMLRNRDHDEKAAAVAAFARDVVPHLASGAIAPVLEAVLPLTRVSEAYDRLASDATFGKLVLDCA